MKFDPTALMGNNPMVQIINMMRGGGDPNALMQQVIKQNPQLHQIAVGKTPEQLMSIAQNMCRERGTNVNEVLKQFGITL